MPLNKSEVGQALLLFDRALFWECGQREIQLLGLEFVVPRVTRYGTLEDVIRLFVIYPAETIREIVDND
jgi:hypothetical protein